MPKLNTILNRFNYGLVSPKALARRDVARLSLGAEIQTNVIGGSLGYGMFRPGLGYTGSTRNNAKAKHIPFVYALDDTAIIEITDSFIRIKIDESPITRPSVTTAITNGTFATDLTGWTDADESGATSYHSDTYMVLQGTGTSAAKRYQQVAVSGGNIGVEHAVRFTITRGPVTIRIGSTLGGDEYLPETTVENDGYGPGVYSFAFAPSGDFYIEVSNDSAFADSLIDSIAVESSGAFTLPVPYVIGDLPNIRYDQSGNVIYIACDGCPQKKLVRYGTRSWGISDYSPNDGPFRNINVSSTTMTPSGLTGQITLTSSSPYFRESMEGGLFKLTSTGQKTQNTLTASGDATDYIKITGVGDARKFDVVVTGTWTGTLQIQRSISEPGAWAASGLTSITTNGTYTYDDDADNAIYYYRVLGFTISSGTPTITITTGQGSITGIVRALDYSSSTSMVCSVLKPLGGTTATDLWYEGAWSDYRGYPQAVKLHEGRLWWAGKDKIWGSVSDAYESFDDEEDGDSGPISVQLGSGPIDKIHSLLSLFRLVILGQTAERTARSTSLDEPLTPTNFSLKTDSTRGSSPVQAAVVDQSGFFVRNDRLFNLAPSDRVDTSYAAADMTLIAPEVGESGFVGLAVQRYPDTRIHCLRADGKVALLVFDEIEEVKAWQLIETDGVIEDVFVLPAPEAHTEDKVYYCVKRTINGSDVRYLEKWAKESECEGGNVNKMADSFIQVTVSGATCSGLSNLEGEEVIVWAEGRDYSTGFGDDQVTYTVTSGAITLGDSLASGSPAIVGLPYSGKYKSTKLAYGAGMGEALCQKKRVAYLGLILHNTHNKGLQYGPTFDIMDDMPRVEDGAVVADDYIWSHYDKDALEFNGDWDTDSRICLQFQAPRPATVLGVVVGIQTNDKI